MTANTDAEYTFNFDLEKMKEAMSGPTISFPPGLTGEQRRAFIRMRLKEIDEQKDSEM
jgi:hypothetical protein